VTNGAKVETVANVQTEPMFKKKEKTAEEPRAVNPTVHSDHPKVLIDKGKDPKPIEPEPKKKNSCCCIIS
jgi:hypothetical protein